MANVNYFHAHTRTHGKKTHARKHSCQQADCHVGLQIDHEPSARYIRCFLSFLGKARGTIYREGRGGLFVNFVLIFGIDGFHSVLPLSLIERSMMSSHVVTATVSSVLNFRAALGARSSWIVDS
jgi:hypothetical protein